MLGLPMKCINDNDLLRDPYLGYYLHKKYIFQNIYFIKIWEIHHFLYQ